MSSAAAPRSGKIFTAHEPASSKHAFGGLTHKNTGIRGIAPSIVRTNAPTATDVATHLDLQGHGVLQTRSQVTKVTRIGRSLSYPRCPPPGEFGTLICPYCNDKLPKSLHHNEDEWKAHVVQDILPYSCIISDCETPFEMYHTAENLLAHMMEKHSTLRWICDHCALESSVHHEDNVRYQFDTAEAWEVHMLQAHQGIISANHANHFAKLNGRRILSPLSCPLCNLYPDDEDHVLQHIHEFALWALPDSSGGKDDQKSITSQDSGNLSHTEDQLLRDLSFRAGITVEELGKYLTHNMQNFELAPLRSLVEQILERVEQDDVNESLRKELLETCYMQVSNISKDTSDFAAEYILAMARDSAISLEQFMTDVSRYTTLVSMVKKRENFKAFALPDLKSLSVGPEDQLNEAFILLQERLFHSVRGSLVYGIESQVNDQPRVVITGEFGVGKTALAAQFARKTMKEHTDCSVFWVEGRSMNATVVSYKGILEIVTTGTTHNPTFGDFRFASYYLDWLHQGPWLMILDDMRPEVLCQMIFAGWLPSGLQGRLLFTIAAEHLDCITILGPTHVMNVPKGFSRDFQSLFRKGSDSTYPYIPDDNTNKSNIPTDIAPILQTEDEIRPINEEDSIGHVSHDQLEPGRHDKLPKSPRDLPGRSNEEPNATASDGQHIDQHLPTNQSLGEPVPILSPPAGVTTDTPGSEAPRSSTVGMGLEKTGLLLTSYPLIIASLEFYANGIAVTKRYWRYRAEFQRLILGMRTEYGMCSNSLHLLLVGIVKDKDMAEFLAHPDGQRWKDTNLEQVLQQRLGSRYKSYTATIEELHKTMEVFKKRLKLDPETGKPLFNESRALKENKKRLKFSLNKIDYDDLMATLRHANMSLSWIARRNVSLEGKPRSAKQGARQVVNFSAINDQVQDIHSILKSNWKCNRHADHTVYLRLEPRIARSDGDSDDEQATMLDPFHVLFQYRHQAVLNPSNPGLSPTLWTWQEVRLRVTTQGGASGSSPIAHGVSKRIRFADEAKTAAKAPLGVPLNVQPITDLCTTLGSLEAPQRDVCLSLSAKDDHVQKYILLIYPDPEPPRNPETWSVLDLRSVLTNIGLADRLRLAVTIASSVLQLHGTPWLHENWSMDDIFIKKSAIISYEHPFVSQRFDQEGKPGSSGASPRLNRIIRNPTLYSLGVFLVELYYRKPLSDMYHPLDGPLGVPMTGWVTADRLAEELEMDAGNNYSEAVQRCIRCEFDGRKGDLQKFDFQKAFYLGVIIPLKDTLDFLTAI